MNGVLKFSILLVILFCFSCKSKIAGTGTGIDKFPFGRYIINYGGCSGSDSLEFIRAGDNLYKDNNANLYFLSADHTDETGKYIPPVFILRFYNYCEGDSADMQYNISNTIDIATFKSLGDGFYHDRYRKYYFTATADGGQLDIVQNDRSTYKELGKGFFSGADGKMYIETAEVSDGGKGDGVGPSFFREVPFVDVKTFENLGQEGWYAKDSLNVYVDDFMSDGRHISIVKEADARSFQSIGYRWGKDKNHVFQNGILLEGIHPDSMIILCPETTSYKQVFFSMVKDNNQVYYDYMEMEGVDAPTFECVNADSTVTFRDKNWNYNKNYFPNRNESDRTKR